MKKLILMCLFMGLIILGCGDDDDDNDTGNPDASTDDDDVTDDDDNDDNDDNYPATKVTTTLVRTLQPVEEKYAESARKNPAILKYADEYLSEGLGNYSFGDGESHTLRTDIVPDYTAAEGAARKSVQLFFHVTDVHITDDESPNRIATLDNTEIGGSMRPQDSYSTHGLDALVRSLKPFSDNGLLDYLIATGDSTDNAINTELQQFIGVLNGQKDFSADTGADDDPVPGPDNDPKDTYDTPGLDVPWFWVYGNHDLLIVGNSAPSDESNDDATGTAAGSGTRDWSNHGEITSGDVPADENRWVDNSETIAEELTKKDGGSGPDGHGLTKDNLDSGVFHYVTRPVEGVPIVIVSMALVDLTGGADGIIFQKDIDDFLIPALDEATANGDLVIVATHFPPTSLDRREGLMGDTVPDSIEPFELVNVLNEYPNVILHIAGHTHANYIRPHSAPADKGDEFGYWEVVTCSFLDFPQQGRFIEIVSNGDGTGSVFVTLMDYSAPEGSLAEMGRKLSIIDYLTGWSSEEYMGIEHRNAELVFKMTDEMAEKIDALELNEDVQSLTSLQAEYEVNLKWPGVK